MTLELVRPALEYLPEYKAALERDLVVRQHARGRRHSRRFDRATIAGLSSLAVGRRVLRQHWHPLAAGNAGAAASRAGPHRLWGGAVEARARLRQARSGADARRSPVTGLPFVEVTTDLDNAASQAVIRANGGRLVECFRKPAAYGGKDALRFHIALSQEAVASP